MGWERWVPNTVMGRLSVCVSAVTDAYYLNNKVVGVEFIDYSITADADSV
jgi:hypothetical protein